MRGSPIRVTAKLWETLGLASLMKASGGMEAVCWDILAEDSGKRVFEVTSLEAWLSLREG